MYVPRTACPNVSGYKSETTISVQIHFEKPKGNDTLLSHNQLIYDSVVVVFCCCLFVFVLLGFFL